MAGLVPAIHIVRRKGRLETMAFGIANGALVTAWMPATSAGMTLNPTSR